MKKYPHVTSCKCGAIAEHLPLDQEHDWYVNSPDHHNCFWTYIRHKEQPHTLNEIAKLLNLSISAITSIERKAYKKLKYRLKHLELNKK